MNQLLCFTKKMDQHNILFDEFFHEATEIVFIAFNYDNAGSALCHCDGRLQVLDPGTVEKILFGVGKERLDTYIQSIFRAELDCDDVIRVGGSVQFRLRELNEQDKYEVGNHAKQTHKELLALDADRFQYFEEKKPQSALAPSSAATVFANPDSKGRIFHRPDCKACNSKTCTAQFPSPAAAVAAGFRACKLCAPEGK